MKATIYRSEHTSDSTYIPTLVVQDSSLSYAARGLFGVCCYLQQHHGIDIPTVDAILDSGLNGSSGRTATTKALKELRDRGLTLQSKPKQTRSPGYIYLLYCPEWGLCKIGLSKTPDVRIHQIIAAIQKSVQPVAFIPCQDMGRLESRLHYWYWAYRVCNEWFELTPESMRMFESTATYVDNLTHDEWLEIHA